MTLTLLQRERGQRTRRRDHDRVERDADEDRFERSENSPPADFPGRNSGGPDGMNPDEPIFDSFGPPGLHSGPFPSDIPPPLLMPVPGAG